MADWRRAIAELRERHAKKLRITEPRFLQTSELRRVGKRYILGIDGLPQLIHSVGPIVVESPFGSDGTADSGLEIPGHAHLGFVPGEVPEAVGEVEQDNPGYV